MSLTKTTTLEDYYATGDGECFCFDRCSGPTAHFNRPSYQRWLRRQTIDYDPDHCRVYPNELLPKGSKGLRGSWQVTITFIPEDKE